MVEDKIKVFANNIVKLKDKVYIHFNNNEFVYAKFFYDHKSTMDNLLSYTNILVFRKNSINLTFDTQEMVLPIFLWKAFDINKVESKYVVLLDEFTSDEIITALTIAKKKMDIAKTKKIPL